MHQSCFLKETIAGPLAMSSKSASDMSSTEISRNEGYDVMSLVGTRLTGDDINDVDLTLLLMTSIELETAIY